jgi:hypothetical protein
MKETFGEKFNEKIFGINWEIRFLKSEIKNADYYMNEARKEIVAVKKKYPNDWRKRIGGWKFEIRRFRDSKAEDLKSLARWEKIKKAHKLGRII